MAIRSLKTGTFSRSLLVGNSAYSPLYYVYSLGSVAADWAQNIYVNSTGNIFLGLVWSSQSRAGVTKLNGSLTNSTLSINTARRFQPGGVTGANCYGFAVDSSENLYCSGTATAGSWVLKLDTAFAYQWARRLSGGTAGTSINSVGVDSSGNVYALTSGVYLVKYNSSGTLQWQRKLTWASGTIANSNAGVGLFVTSSGDCHIICNDSTNSLSSWIIKYNTSGSIQWQRALSLSATSINYHALHVDSNGDIWIVGDATISSVVNTILVKYNSSGTYQYTRRVACGFSGRGIARDAAGNLYITANTIGSGSALFKYNSSGTIQWQRAFGGTTVVNLYGVAVDSSYQVYATGYRNDPNSNIFLVRLDQNGNPTSSSYTLKSVTGNITSSAYTASSGSAASETAGGLTDAAGDATDTLLNESANLTSETGFTAFQTLL